jgi:hypothetical protein
VKRTYRLLVVGALVVAVALALTLPAAAALTDGAYHCNLTGGNGIVVDFRLTEQGPNPPGSGFFALTGQWDDSSLTPFLPIFGAVLVDPNFDVVGGFTYVGFRPNTPLPGSPFGSWPAGVQVQFRLEEVLAGPAVAFRGRWADNRGNVGRMTCTVTTP